jgi:hypothetical protein
MGLTRKRIGGRKTKAKSMKGGALSALSPASAVSKSIGAYSVGPAFVDADANYAENPDMFSSPFAKVSGHGCAGTKCNATAAEGRYESYKEMIKSASQMGGTKLAASCPPNHQPTAEVTGPKSGHAPHCAYSAGPEKSSTSLKGGKRKARKGKKSAKRKSASKRKGKGTKRGRKHSTRRSRRHGSKRHGRKARKHTRRVRFHRGGSVVSGVPEGSNVPWAYGMSVAGVDLPASESYLANPPPFTRYDHCEKNDFPKRA